MRGEISTLFKNTLRTGAARFICFCADVFPAPSAGKGNNRIPASSPEKGRRGSRGMRKQGESFEQEKSEKSAGLLHALFDSRHMGTGLYCAEGWSGLSRSLLLYGCEKLDLSRGDVSPFVPFVSEEPKAEGRLRAGKRRASRPFCGGEPPAAFFYAWAAQRSSMPFP